MELLMTQLIQFLWYTGRRTNFTDHHFSLDKQLDKSCFMWVPARCGKCVVALVRRWKTCCRLKLKLKFGFLRISNNYILSTWNVPSCFLNPLFIPIWSSSSPWIINNIFLSRSKSVSMPQVCPDRKLLPQSTSVPLNLFNLLQVLLTNYESRLRNMLYYQ